MRYGRFWAPQKRLDTAVSAAGSIRIGRMLVYGRFRPTADGWPWLTAESAASHVKQGIFPCFKIPVCSCARSYKQERTAVTQALEVAAIERVGSELDSEPDLTICWVCFILPKPMNMSTVK